jgi:hypothetical protein
MLLLVAAEEATNPSYLVGHVHLHPSLYGVGLILLAIGAPGRIALWLLTSYLLAFAFEQWGDPTGSSKTWAIMAVRSLVCGIGLLVILLFIAVGSDRRAFKILAQLLT